MQRACKDKIKYIHELLNKDLNNKNNAYIETHLEICTGCSEYYREMSAVKNALGNIDLKAPEDLTSKIMSSVITGNKTSKNKTNKWLKPAYIASYATAACIVLVLSLFILNGGLLNKGVMESSEMSESDQQSKTALANRTESGLLEDSSSDNAFETILAAPAPEPEAVSPVVEFREPGYTAEILDVEGFKFNTSGFYGSNSIIFNKDGSELDKTYGYIDSQDILYVTANYNLKEIKNILLMDFGLRVSDSDESSVLLQIPDSLINSIEKRLDLAAAEAVENNSVSYLVRILSLVSE